MSNPMYVIVLTSPDTAPNTLGTVVYRAYEDAESRADERRRVATEQGWPVEYRVYQLVEVTE